MRKTKVLAAILSVVPFVFAPRVSAQISCSNPLVSSIPVPAQTRILYSCSMQNSSYSSTFITSTGQLSTVDNSGQVPRLPSKMSVTYSWEPSSGLGTYYVVNVRDSSGNIAKQYTLGLGTFLMYPAIDGGNKTQTAVFDVSGWPSGFTLELIQYDSFFGSTQIGFDLRLFN